MLPMHGGVLIELSHDLLSSGYVYDLVPLGQAMMEHDTQTRRGCLCNPPHPRVGGMHLHHLDPLAGRDWQRRLRPNEPTHLEVPSQNATKTSQMSSWGKPLPTFPLARHGIMP